MGSQTLPAAASDTRFCHFATPHEQAGIRTDHGWYIGERSRWVP
jgi:hypothetical protein